MENFTDCEAAALLKIKDFYLVNFYKQINFADEVVQINNGLIISDYWLKRDLPYAGE